MFDDRELSGMQGLDDSARGMKPKVQIDRRAEEVVDVDDVGADVERNQCQPINPDDRHSPIVKVFRNVPGAAADVGDESPTACCLGEPIQEMPIERFLGQLRGKMCGVGFGGRVVTVTDIHNPQAPSACCVSFFGGRLLLRGRPFFFAGAADFGRAWRGS